MLFVLLLLLGPNNKFIDICIYRNMVKRNTAEKNGRQTEIQTQNFSKSAYVFGLVSLDDVHFMQ